MRRVAVLLVLILSGLVLVASAAADTTIDTISLWNGTDLICSFGNPDTATYGQTVTVPAGDTTLRSFTFAMVNVPSTAVFRGEVYAWDGPDFRAQGPSLFESAPTSTPGLGEQDITFTVPHGLALSPGEQIVIFASVSKDYNESTLGTGCWGGTSDETYAGGEFVYLNNEGNPSAWTADPWSSYVMPDAAFMAHFTPPTASLWLAAGPPGAKIDVRASLYSRGSLVAQGTLNAISPAGAGPGGSELEQIPLAPTGRVDAKHLTLVVAARTACTSPDGHTKTTLYFGSGAADSSLDGFSRPVTHLSGDALKSATGTRLQSDKASSTSCTSWQYLGSWGSG
jgi:hypothetical protein